MPTIRLEIFIAAPPERCFDLARDIDLHSRSVAYTRERAVAGVTRGLIGPGQTVTWEAVHLGVRQRLTVQITQYDRPRAFTDEMVRGAFAAMRHVHEFVPVDGGTLMRDVMEYRAPLGPLGRLADRLFLERHLRVFLTTRSRYLKQVAEATGGTPSRAL
jgi:ligand-binding SRPBCC domain-containing protein